MKLSCHRLACGYGHRTVLRELDLSLDSGEALCLLGPNGVGKTTLFKTLLGLLPRQGGEIRLDGIDLNRWSARRRAHAMAYVPQAHTPPFPFRVGEVVLMGRHARVPPFAAPGPEDRRLAREALGRLGIESLEDVAYTALSGGERQLVLIARALAQGAALMLLDEPTANLDFGNQIRVLGELDALVRAGIGVLMTTNSPNHAFLAATRVALLGADGSLSVGAPESVLTEESLRAAFGVEVYMTEVPAGPGRRETRACVPLLPRRE